MIVQSPGVFNDVSEEHTASIFRVKTYAQQAASRASGLTAEDKYVGLQVLTAVTINSIILWDVTPCCPVEHSWLLAWLRVKMEEVFFRNFGQLYPTQCPPSQSPLRKPPI
jgi:hypothetical protein